MCPLCAAEFATHLEAIDGAVLSAVCTRSRADTAGDWRGRAGRRPGGKGCNPTGCGCGDGRRVPTGRINSCGAGAGCGPGGAPCGRCRRDGRGGASSWCLQVCNGLAGGGQCGPRAPWWPVHGAVAGAFRTPRGEPCRWGGRGSEVRAGGSGRVLDRDSDWGHRRGCRRGRWVGPSATGRLTGCVRRLGSQTGGATPGGLSGSAGPGWVRRWLPAEDGQGLRAWPYDYFHLTGRRPAGRAVERAAGDCLERRPEAVGMETPVAAVTHKHDGCIVPAVAALASDVGVRRVDPVWKDGRGCGRCLGGVRCRRVGCFRHGFTWGWGGGGLLCWRVRLGRVRGGGGRAR